MKTAGILLLVLISMTSFAFKSNGPGKLLLPQFSTARECVGRPEFLSEVRSDFTSSLSHLPQTLLIARDAEYYIEGQRDHVPVKMYGYQTFLKKNANTRILCGQAAESLTERFSIIAPTLIDTHKQPRVGQSLWQFQMMADGNKFSFWNLKSSSFGSQENVESLLKETGVLFKVYQRSHDEYELFVIKKEGSITQYLSIRYDAVPQLRR